MLKILNTTQIKALDKATIEGEPIASIDLMERASMAFVRWFVVKFNYKQKVGIICGTGNNGGDGLAIARLLTERRYNIAVWIVRGSAPETEDFKANLARLSGVTPTIITAKPTDALFNGVDVLVDALFGSGLSRALEGTYAGVVETLNRADGVRVAVDVPSGLMCDAPSSGPIVKADFTVTFQLPKLTFMLPEYGAFVGHWELVDIGLSKSHIAQAETSNFFLTSAWARTQINPRKKFTHKGDHGKALVVAGSYGMMGACVLTTRATLRSGAGLVTAHVPRCGYDIIQSSAPEAMASVDAHESYLTTVPDLEGYTCIGIGPGLGTHGSSAKVVEKVLLSGKPAVIDADAINLIVEHGLQKLLHSKAVLTPHPGEFRRLAGDWANDFARLELQRKLSVQTGATIVLKGAHTSIATRDGHVRFNSTGNPGMATGGSGDVLTGIITGLLAQGLDPSVAAALGVYLHGKAGDRALAQMGGHAIIASDIIDMIPSSLRSSFL